MQWFNSLRKRRIGAGTYLIAMSGAVIVWALCTWYVSENFAKARLISETELNACVSVIGILVGWVFWPLSAGRLRDLNCPGWSVNILAFPFFGVMVLPVLCFLSGNRWENMYGEPPEPSGVLKILAALVLFGAAVVLCNAALISFYAARYLLQHA
jgi:uncharacterized membrane protein YhaH (DUF805 family)